MKTVTTGSQRWFFSKFCFLFAHWHLGLILPFCFSDFSLRDCWPRRTCSPARGGSFSSSSLNIRRTKEPPVFGGNSSTSVSFQEWVFTVEVALEAADLPGQQEVSFAASYLTGNALAWFLAIRRAGEEFENWQSSKAAISIVFGPTYVEEEAHLSLFRTRYNEDLDEYVADHAVCSRSS